jgi:hypothetical protein
MIPGCASPAVSGRDALLIGSIYYLNRSAARRIAPLGPLPSLQDADCTCGHAQCHHWVEKCDEKSWYWDLWGHGMLIVTAFGVKQGLTELSSTMRCHAL